jgi:hypothetical protein
MPAKRARKGTDGIEPIQPTGVAFLPKLQRIRYFGGRLLLARDFELEQNYFLEKHRLHNRLLHGSGIVIGLEVSLDQAQIVVQPGCALDCLGNLICVPEATQVPLPTEGDNLLYVKLEYRECITDPAPVPGEPCETEEVGMATNRITEMFQLTYESGNPFQRHPRHFCGFQACGQPHGVPLVRLCRSGGRWSLDGRFIAPRMASLRKH